MSNHKIYVKNLAAEVNEDLLKDHFAKYGEITDISLPLDRRSKQPKGYAFISFADEAMAGQALAEDAQTFLDQEIVVQIAIEKAAKRSVGID